MKAAVFESFGEPSEVLSVRDVPEPKPGPGEVRVRMIASPINPSDLLVVRGRYGVLPSLPSTPGFEGVGIVDQAGPGLLGRWVEGKRVAVINSAGGNWAEYAVIPARQARPIPADIPDEQAATFFVNPATVLAMVRHVLGVPRGEWLLQSAAGSTLGKMIIKLGRHDGFKTLNVVRRSEAKEELTRLGADAVISSSEGPIEEQVKRITGNEGVRYALDPIGGETGTGVFQSLGSGGRMVVYGTLSGRSDPDRSPTHDLGSQGCRGILARPLDEGSIDPLVAAPVPRDRRLDSPGCAGLRSRPVLPARGHQGGGSTRRCRGSRRQGAPQAPVPFGADRLGK